MEVGVASKVWAVLAAELRRVVTECLAIQKGLWRGIPERERFSKFILLFLFIVKGIK